MVLDDKGDRLGGFPNDDFVRLHHLHAVENIENTLSDIEKEPAARLAGMLVDFHLLGDRASEWTIESCLDRSAVQIRTGLGAMLYMRDLADVPNDLPLFALTTLSQPHHALFYSAAHLWFGARPIDALMDLQKLRSILIGDDPVNVDSQTEPVDRMVRAAEDAFEDLLNSCLEWRNCREAYYWFKQLRQGISLNSFRGLKIGLEGRYGQLQRVRRNRSAQEFNEFAYNRLLTQWQELAAENVTAWGGSTEGWPDLVQAGNGLALWNEHNPVLDLVKDGVGVGGAPGSGAYNIFFSEPDVLEALLYWRAQHSGHACWGSGGSIIYKEPDA